MRIVVAGVGAIGGWFSCFARNIPGCLFHYVDFDTVAAKDTQAQVYPPHSIRLYKSTVLRSIAIKDWGIRPTHSTEKVTDLNTEAVLGQCDLVVDCFDNAPSRRLLVQYGRRWGIPVVHAAIDRWGMAGLVQWEEYVPQMGAEGVPTCENGANLPHHTMVASVLAKIVGEFVKSGKKVSVEINGVRVQLGEA